MTYAPAMRTRTQAAGPLVVSVAAPAQGWVRLARAAILGSTSLFLATAGHMIGGGTLPGAGLLAVTGVALALVSVSLTSRRLRFVPLLAVLSVEQGLLHLLFHAATTGSICTTGAMAGHAMTAAPASPSLTGCGLGAATTTGWSMVLGHALAVVATAWLLAYGERWLWRVVERTHRYATARPSRRRRPRIVIVGSGARWCLERAWRPAGPRGPPFC